MPRVLLFTNTVAPYRMPVFERLAQQVDLQVLFAQGSTADRQWEADPDSYGFCQTILSHRTLRLGSAAQLINPGLLRRLMHSRFDIVILGDNRQTTLSALALALAASVRRQPFIVWTGATSDEDRVARSPRSLRCLFARYRHLLFRRASAVLAYGKATSRHLSGLGIPQDKTFSGTQIVPRSQLPPPASDSADLGLTGKTVVLSVNYLVPRKGLHVLIQAFRQVAGPDDVLVLVGSGPEEPRLKKLANGDERILFPGYQSDADKTAWYAAADVFAFPTLHDPWGLVVNEAMAFGLPILATDAAGCVPDLVQDNGLVVPAGDVDALANALARLLEDEDLRSKTGRRSQAIIADYTVERASDTFLRAIHYALEA